jgi:HipA-like kinase
MQPVRVTRYVTPLREGGSLPGLMEAADLGMYVVKFRGAGQGTKALVAEVVCAELAGAAGLRVPRWVPVDLPGALAAAEPDEEVQYLLRASAGVNLGIDFLPGALDVGPRPAFDGALAGRIIWFDALVGNMDRSWRNPNMLVWHRDLYLIDHGAALTFHHAWSADPSIRATQVERFGSSAYAVADHALVECRPDVGAADSSMAAVDWTAAIDAAVAAVPESWLGDELGSTVDARSAYREFLAARVAARASWVPALADAVLQGAARDERGHRIPARASSGPPDWIPELRGRPGGGR